MAPRGSLLAILMFTLSTLPFTPLATSPEQPLLPISSISAAPSVLPTSPAPLSSPATISAAPVTLPTSPVSPSPALSPDMEPLFPSPRHGASSPTESTLPIIPSSPSPPNPDDTVAPEPDSALAPSHALPVSAADCQHHVSSRVLVNSLVGVMLGSLLASHLALLPAGM